MTEHICTVLLMWVTWELTRKPPPQKHVQRHLSGIFLSKLAYSIWNLLATLWWQIKVSHGSQSLGNAWWLGQAIFIIGNLPLTSLQSTVWLLLYIGPDSGMETLVFKNYCLWCMRLMATMQMMDRKENQNQSAISVFQMFKNPTWYYGRNTEL